MPKTKQRPVHNTIQNTKKASSASKPVTTAKDDEDIVLPPIVEAVAEEKLDDADGLPADPLAEDALTDEDEEESVDTFGDVWAE